MGGVKQGWSRRFKGGLQGVRRGWCSRSRTKLCAVSAISRQFTVGSSAVHCKINLYGELSKKLYLFDKKLNILKRL